MTPESTTHQPERLLAGRCPDCRRLVVVFNNYESWPLVACECGWEGPTGDVAERIRIDRHGTADVSLRAIQALADAINESVRK